MKKSLTIVLALFVVALFVISTAVAGEEKKPDEKLVPAAGQVKVTKDAGNVTGVKIGEQAVALDPMGMDLAALMDGKRSMARGVMVDKVLTLRKFTVSEVVGLVEVKKEGEKIESGKIISAAGPEFTLDKKSAEEVARMDGKNVKVGGTVSLAKDGAKTLTIQGAVMPAPEKKAGAAEKKGE